MTIIIALTVITVGVFIAALINASVDNDVVWKQIEEMHQDTLMLIEEKERYLQESIKRP